MAELFDEFPCLENETLIIRKMTEADLDALCEITENANVYRYIPPFLYRKSKGNLLAAIRNLGGRDFDKRKMIIAGVYLTREPSRLIGLAEMFDYHKRTSQITIGYRLNELYWHQGLATQLIAMMLRYLTDDMKINTVKAFVMPDNAYSIRALIRNGFQQEDDMASGENWGGQDTAKLYEYTYTRNGNRIGGKRE